MRRSMTLAAIAVLMTFAAAASAAEVEIKMLNKGAEGVMVFEPATVSYTHLTLPTILRV